MDQLSLKIIKIRKPQKCWGCAGEFPVGTELTRSVIVDQGEFSSDYWCNECEALLNSLELWQLEEGFAMGELLNYKE
ncbi:MAG: hypothetical protein PF693_09950 [Spirochaetia bacterium]|jgi:hypothetical protein|nr:hypothetical protein [Spirochaetia bacterium]